MDWNYRKEQVILSIKGYVQKALEEYQHKIQYERVDKSKPLSPKQIKTIQEVFGKFLYISQAIDNTMQHALNELCIAVTKGDTRNTIRSTRIFSKLLLYTPRSRNYIPSQ